MQWARADGILEPVDSPALGQLWATSGLWRFGDGVRAAATPAPRLGADTAWALERLIGLSQAEIGEVWAPWCSVASGSSS